MSQGLEPRLAAVDVFTSAIALRAPYVLSFATLTEFRSAFMEITLEDGRRGLGEATALPGYGEETHEEVAAALDDLAPRLTGLRLSEARSLVDSVYATAPFCAAAAGVALDFASGAYVVPSRLHVPILAPVAASADHDGLKAKVRAAQARGFRTIKVKVGTDVDMDIAAAEALLDLPLDISYRFDANQGYDPVQAEAFLRRVNNGRFSRMEYLEQPLFRRDWDNAARLCRAWPGQIMLDESIYDVADVERAASIGASFVKLKLFKTKGVGHLLDITRRARTLGLRVILGNGVATDVCNLAEAVAFTAQGGLYHGGCEGNGFAKMVRPVRYPLREENGALTL